MNTPWGIADDANVISEGITFYSTPSHGGFKVDAKRLKEMSIQYRNKDGWYEEDCEASKVVLAFPHLFKPHQVDEAAEIYTAMFNIDGTYKERK